MNLVEEKQRGLIPPDLMSWPLQLIEHLTNTTSVAPPPAGPAGCRPLYLLDLLYLSFFLSFFLSIFTGSLIHEHYTRECEFGNFDKIKNKTTQKKQHKNLWLNFCLNKECPKLLCGLGICLRRRQTIPMWNSTGEKEFFRASLYVWCLRY